MIVVIELYPLSVDCRKNKVVLLVVIIDTYSYRSNQQRILLNLISYKINTCKNLLAADCNTLSCNLQSVCDLICKSRKLTAAADHEYRTYGFITIEFAYLISNIICKPCQLFIYKLLNICRGKLMRYSHNILVGNCLLLPCRQLNLLS